MRLVVLTLTLGVIGCNGGGGGRSTAPTVMSVSPTDAATSVALDVTLPAEFNKDMDPATIDTTTFTLEETVSGNPVAGTTTYDPATKTATFTPNADLAPAMSYTAALTTGITSMAGLALATPFTWSFTTTDPTSTSEQYTRTGQTESFSAPLTVFGGTTTTGQWSGLVEVEVSGWGFSTPGSFTDAFYPLDLADHTVMLPGTVQGLRLSFTGCAANVECGAPRIDGFMIFAEGEGVVTAPHRPVYQSDHAYRFVIDVGATPQFLTLGEGDGGVGDNSGQFDLNLYAVVAAP